MVSIKLKTIMEGSPYLLHHIILTYPSRTLSTKRDFPKWPKVIIERSLSFWYRFAYLGFVARQQQSLTISHSSPRPQHSRSSLPLQAREAC
jgi:hypothetical protein